MASQDEQLLSRFVRRDFKVSHYIMEVLGLDIREQKHLMFARFVKPAGDQVMLVARALKEIRATAVKKFKFCVDPDSKLVFVLTDKDCLGGFYRSFMFTMANEHHLQFWEVKSIVSKQGSFEAFYNIPNRIKVVVPRNSIVPDAVIPFSLEQETVSLFVAEYLGLSVGHQGCLLAGKGLAGPHKIYLAARAIRQNRGKEFLSVYKFVLDSTNDTVYILSVNEDDAKMMTRRSWTIAGEVLTLYRVLAITVLPKEEDLYQSVKVEKVLP